MRKLKTGSRAWMKSLKHALIAECPDLVECRSCGRIIRAGYVCYYCKTETPGSNAIQPEEWLSF